MNCGKELDFSVSTNSPLQFYFNDEKSVKSSDCSEDNELEDPSYCPIIKKKETKKYSILEKYKEMLSVLNKIYSLITIIQDRTVIKPVVSSDMKLELFTNGILHSYQISGYKWILSLFENGLNGILADEMGLGKTIEVIAFFCHVIQNNVPGPFLVVVPLSILPNWMHELQRFAPKLPVLFHYGCNRFEHLSHFKLQKIEISENLVVESYPIILTSYEIAKRDVHVFHAITFKAIIVDEGHRIKNYDSKLLNALKKYKSDLRLILTGTPLQNNMYELWCLLFYVMPDIFRSVEALKDWLTPSASLELFQNEVIYEEEERALITTIHKILSPFILRRLKSEVQLSVPSKKEIILSISLTEEQKSMYDKIIDGNFDFLKFPKFNNFDDFNDSQSVATRVKENKSKRKVEYPCYKLSDYANSFIDILETKISSNPYKNHSIIKKKFQNPNYELHFQNRNVSLLLRKIVNHPYMICYPLNSKGEYDVTEHIIKISNKMKILDRLLEKLKISNHKVLIFSQFNDMLDILQDYLNYKNWQYGRMDGSMSIDDRRDQIDWFTVDPNIFCFLLNTKTGGVGINLSVADTVIIYDSDWNPQCDIQAQDRCHRIGQLNPVLIFRLIIKDTVDQYIINKANLKRNFEKTVLHGKKFKGKFFEKNDDKNYQDFDKDNYNTNVESFNCMSKNEMIDLLTFRINEKIINFDTLTDDDIEKLLDRYNLQR